MVLLLSVRIFSKMLQLTMFALLHLPYMEQQVAIIILCKEGPQREKPISVQTVQNSNCR